MGQLDNFLTYVREFTADHQLAAILAGAVVALLLTSLVAAQIWAGYRGRSLSARASIGFAAVQAGVAFVTITGVYELWEEKVQVPQIEAALIATLIEAVTWAAVAMIFVHGSSEGTVGFGDAGPLFWMSVIGGGLMAIAGSSTLAIALARTVVVVLGANMWYLRLRQATRRPTTRKTKWTITPRQFVIRRGWLAADDGDVIHSSREWQVRTLARAIRRRDVGGPVAKWLGKRAIIQVMESGDADMVRQAQARYALARVLDDDLSTGSHSMTKAIEAAREALYPPPVPDRPAAPSAPPAAAVTAPAERAPQADVPAEPVRTERPAQRTVAATAARSDRAQADQLKRRAVREALAALSADPPREITGKQLGEKFAMSPEWGRLRIVEARSQIQPVAQVNGHVAE